MRIKINKNIKRIYVLAFFFSLHIALSAYINSTFLSDVIGEKHVGLLYVISSFIILFMLSRSSYILSKVGNKNFILSLLLINMLGLLLLIKTKVPMFVSIGFIAFQATNTLVFFSLDIFMEHFSNIKNIGKSRGTYLTINNFAWMLSPTISGLLITKAGGEYTNIYLIALIAVIIMTLGVMLSIKTFKDTKYKKAPFLTTYKYLQKNNHLFAINAIFFLLQFFYVWMVIYIPIYLNQHVGLPWDKIGLIFTVMLAPFVLLGIPVGRLIDRYNFHKRKIITLGVVIAAGATLVIPLINHSSSIFVWMVILFFTRVGASMIETTSEVYFFTHVKEEESNLLSLFRDMSPVAYLVAPLLGTAVLSFVDIRYMFFALSIILIFALRYVPKLKHNHEVSDQNK